MHPIDTLKSLFPNGINVEQYEVLLRLLNSAPSLFSGEAAPALVPVPVPVPALASAPPFKVLIPLEEAAERLGVKVETIKRYCLRGVLQGAQVSGDSLNGEKSHGTWMVRLSSVEAALARKEARTK